MVAKDSKIMQLKHRVRVLEERLVSEGGESGEHVLRIKELQDVIKVHYIMLHAGSVDAGYFQ